MPPAITTAISGTKTRRTSRTSLRRRRGGSARFGSSTRFVGAGADGPSARFSAAAILRPLLAAAVVQRRGEILFHPGEQPHGGVMLVLAQLRHELRAGS